jgi:CCR4-NOT transcription complex subunit 1
LRKQVNKLLEELRSSSGGAGAQQQGQQPTGGKKNEAPQQGQQQQQGQDGNNNVESGPATEGSGASTPSLGGGPQASDGTTDNSDFTRKAAEALALTARSDPPATRQQVTFLLDYWIRVYNETFGNEKAYAQYLQLLQQHGVGKSEENTERFFRVSTELVVEAVLKSGANNGVLHLNVVDAYAKLVALLFKYMNSGGTQEQVQSQRINLLNKVLGITVRILMASFERSKANGTDFDQRPFFRLLLNLVQDLNSPDPQLDPISLQILGVFGSAFHIIQPVILPGFAFAWLELISHRMFLPNLLLAKGQKGWGLAHQLLLDLFVFLEPYLRMDEMPESIRHLYKGVLRVLLVLLHDFPSILCDNHVSFCNVIPPNCVQLRNLILSAFPRSMVLPDPLTPNLKVDLLPEISQGPRILSNITGALGPLRMDLDNFLKARQPATFLNQLVSGNLLRKEHNFNELDIPKINSLVVYVGVQAIARLQNGHQQVQLTRTAEMDVLIELMNFDDYGRYVCLNAIANQLRYPNSHTHYFSCVILFMFSEAKSEAVKEQITRVLLERLIVHRPHPWGLLITFIELIKNPSYNFWSHGFTHCATEIERVFESVARSCISGGAASSQGNNGGNNNQGEVAK